MDLISKNLCYYNQINQYQLITIMRHATIQYIVFEYQKKLKYKISLSAKRII